MRIFAVIGLLFLFCAGPGFAATAWQESFNQGRTDFEAGRWQEAFENFNRAFVQEPGNVEISFLLGRSAFESGDFENAVMAFDRVLILDPDSARVKLELARSYMGLEAWSLARRYFEEVLAGGPPPTVRENIETMLAVIDRAEKRHFVNGIFSLEYALDDNARTSPINDIVRTVLGDVTLTGAGAVPETDHIINATLLIKHRYQEPGNPLSWQSTGILFNSAYRDESDLNLRYFGLRTGPAGQRGRLTWEAQALLNHLELDADAYLTSWGLDFGLGLVLNPSGQMKFFIRTEQKDYRTVDARDAIMFRFGIEPAYVVGRNRFILTMEGETEDADNPVYSYNRFKGALAYHRQLPWDYVLMLSSEYRRTEYHGKEPVFARSRYDDVWEFEVGLARVFWRSTDRRRSSLTGRLSHNHTKSDSTISLYSYDKNVTAATVTMGF